MGYYLGIDGGGTKTTAIICDENCKLISSFTGESINFNSIGEKQAQKNLKTTVNGVLAGKNIELNSVFIGMSAIGERAADSFTKEFCSGIINCSKIVMDSDIYVALEAMRCNTPAAVVISGTGSMAAGRLADGTIIHTGGWGYLLGDEGSGYTIALDAVKAAISASEESAKPTALTQAVLDYYKITNMQELIDIYYNPPLPRSEIAKFATVAIKCAEDGDDTAKRILQNNAERLANTVAALLCRLPTGVPLGMWGGVMVNCKELRETFATLVKKRFPKSQLSLLNYSPEYGAVFAAMKCDGIDVTKISF